MKTYKNLYPQIYSFEGRVLKHTADTRKPVKTGCFGPFLSAFQRTLISRR